MLECHNQFNCKYSYRGNLLLEWPGWIYFIVTKPKYFKYYFTKYWHIFTNSNC